MPMALVVPQDWEEVGKEDLGEGKIVVEAAALPWGAVY